MLASCTTQNKASIDTTVQNSLPTVCTGGAISDAGFQAYAEASGKVSEKVIVAENAAFGHLENICNDPEKATATGALIEAIGATGDIAKALHDAHAGA